MQRETKREWGTRKFTEHMKSPHVQKADFLQGQQKEEREKEKVYV